MQKPKTNTINTYLKKQKIIRLVREFFTNNNFQEVNTPLLVPALIPESNIRHITANILTRSGQSASYYLISSPEASLKKLLAKGIGDCFEITRCFRNSEEGSPLHSYEFMMIEWYRRNVDYQKIMNDCEDLILYVYSNIYPENPQPILSVNSNKIDLSKPWIRISVSDALRKFAQISINDLVVYNKINQKFDYPRESIVKIAVKKGYTVKPSTTWEQIFHQIFFNEVEPHLAKQKKPLILYDYPTPLASLARIKEKDPKVAERFELYIGGVELANCFSELTDYNEQNNRFLEEKKLLKKKYGQDIKVDHGFLKALKTGLPKSSGIALGVDRLALLITQTNTINDNIFEFI